MEGSRGTLQEGNGSTMASRSNLEERNESKTPEAKKNTAAEGMEVKSSITSRGTDEGNPSASLETQNEREVRRTAASIQNASNLPSPGDFEEKAMRQRLLELGMTDSDIEATRTRLNKMVKDIDSQASISPEVEELLIRMSLKFLESTTEFACKLASHRKSTEIELADLRLYVEKTLGIKVPGFGSTECSNTSPSVLANAKERGVPGRTPEAHAKRLSYKRKAQDLETEEE